MSHPSGTRLCFAAVLSAIFLAAACSADPKGELSASLSAHLPTADELPPEVLEHFDNSTVEIVDTGEGSGIDWPADYGFQWYEGLAKRPVPSAIQITVPIGLQLSRYETKAIAERTWGERPLAERMTVDPPMPRSEVFHPIPALASGGDGTLRWDSVCFNADLPVPVPTAMICGSFRASTTFCNWTLIVTVGDLPAKQWTAADTEVADVFNVLAEVVMDKVGCSNPNDDTSSPPPAQTE
jgi:hypothetical protein